MATLTTIATVLSIAGAGVTAAGTLAAGAQAQASANFTAKQLEQQAGEERAASQREASEVRKKTNLILSRQRAVAAMTGGASDPTVENLAGDVIQEGGYREALYRYGGENRARGLETQAAASRMEGRASRIGSFYSAAGTLASGAGDMFSKYAKKFPTGESTGGASYYYG